MPCATQKAGQLGKVLAVIRELVSESHSDVAALARIFDIAGDLGELAKRAGQIDEARHLRRRFGKHPFLQILAHIGARLRRSMASSLGYGRIERSTQCVHPQLVDRVAHGVLRRRKGSGGNFGLDPLGRIGCQLDFHGDESLLSEFILP